MADNVTLTPEERIQELSDSILASVIRQDDMAKKNRQMLFGQLSPKAFRDENFVIYSVLYSFKEKGIVPDVDFLKLYLMRNTKLIRGNSSNLDMNAYADSSQDPVTGYIAAVVNQFVRLGGMEGCDGDSFQLLLEKYKSEYSAFEMSKSLSDAKMILYDGMQVGNKTYQGYADSVAYVKGRASMLEGLFDRSTGEGFIDSRLEAIEDKEDKKPELIGDFDMIRPLNKILGGIYTSLFYSVLAPTKGGKSKFCARLAHTIAVVYGNNVSVWAHEGGYAAWWAQLRAIHYEYMYMRGKLPEERPVALSQQDILYNRYPSDDVKSLEQASRMDLFTNPSYGVFHMIDRPFLLETFIDEMTTSVQLNNSKAVIVDYLQLITTNERNIPKNQVVGRAYMNALKFANTLNVAFISPAQFTQDFMHEMASSKADNPEVRTAGGESAEVIRTPDVNIVLYASIDDLQRKAMTIMSAPSRMSMAFKPIPIMADLCSCVFASIED